MANSAGIGLFDGVDRKGVPSRDYAVRTGGLSLGVDCVEWWDDSIDHQVLCERLALRQPPWVPFVVALDGEAHVAIKCDIPSADFASLAGAVTRSGAAMLPRLFTHPRYPIVAFEFQILDDPSDPMRVEAISDIANADVQDFIECLHRNGRVTVHLVRAGEPRRPDMHASGQLMLANARAELRRVALRAVTLLKSIQPSTRSFDLACDAYLSMPEP